MAHESRRGPFHALSFPNFRLFFFGQLVSLAGSWMQIVAQQWLVFDITHSSRWLGIVSGASALPYVLFAIPGGQAADRHPRRRTLIITQTGFALLAVALAALASNRWIHIKPWHVAILAGLTGIVNAFNMPAQQAFVSDMVEDRSVLGNAIALNSLLFNSARFLGPVFAGGVLVKWGAAACFAVNAVSYIAVIISLWMMKLPPFKPHTHESRIWDGFRYIGQNPPVLRIVLLIGSGSLFAWSTSTLFPVFAHLFHRGAAGFTGLVAANGIGAAAGGLFAAGFGNRNNRRALVYGGILAACVSILLFTFMQTYWFALAVIMLAGFAMITFAINANTRVQEEVPDHLRGRVMAVYSLVFLGLFPLGGLEIGFLADRVNPVAAVQLNATIGLIIASSLFAWSQFERARSVQTPEDEDGEELRIAGSRP